MKILYSMIYAPEKGGSGAPIYTQSLLHSIYRNDERPGIVFSAHTSYKDPEKKEYFSYPLRFDHPPIFDNQPKVPHSIAFKDMKKKQIKEYIHSFYDSFKNIITSGLYDLIHVQHGMYIGFVAAMIKRTLGTPYVITLHVMELNFLHEFPDPLLAMVAMTEADKIIALTEAQKKRLLVTYNRENIVKLTAKQKGITKQKAEKAYELYLGKREIDPDNVTVCPLGIDTNMFAINKTINTPEDIQSLNIEKNYNIVLYAGRLIDMKGIKHLLDSERIYNHDGKTHTLVIGGGELEQYVKNMAKKRKNIHYLGFKEQSQMPIYLNYVASHNGIFCVPSSSEGMSLVYLEAMNCGLPVIACCNKDMGDLDFMQEPYAYFAKFGDVADLSNRITSLFKTSLPSRETLRDCANKYNQENMFNLVYAVYRQVLQTHEDSCYYKYLY